MNETTTSVKQFFDRYAAALLARDAAAVAELYAVPSRIVFPGNVIAVKRRQPDGAVLRLHLGPVRGRADPGQADRRHGRGARQRLSGRDLVPRRRVAPLE